MQIPMSMNTRALWHSVAELPSPVSYWNGRRICDGLAPDNILLFPKSYDQPVPANALGSYHPRFVIDLVLGGNGVLQIGSEWHLLKEGECTVVFPHQYHIGGTASEEAPAHWAVTTFDLADEAPIQSLRNAPRRLRASDTARFAAFAEAWKANASGLEVSAHLSRFLRELCHAPLVERRALAPVIDSQRSALLESIVRLQDGGSGDTVAELARAMKITEAALRDRFRKYTGRSLPEFLRRRRLEKAVRLLELPELSIGEIAQRLRFSSVQTFSRIFKERYGVTPKQYETTIRQNLGDTALKKPRSKA